MVEDKKDIAIPQGIAHAVDRVMFPLPVGDLLQTLQSDRDARFSHFLKVLQYSGLVSLFTGKFNFKDSNGLVLFAWLFRGQDRFLTRAYKRRDHRPQIKLIIKRGSKRRRSNILAESSLDN